MRHLFFIALVSSFSFAQDTIKPVIMAHFMPWHQTPSFHGYWGYHWTMNHFNPDSIDSNGHRSIASHYYPLTGPYDSDDTLILEYQTLLMKMSGINGVLVDWYGYDNFWDYGILNVSTQNIFVAIKKAKLRFGIVYEDQSIRHMIETGYLNAEQALEHGKTTMKYLEDHWFGTSNYLKLDNRPVLLVFGPNYFKQSSEWDTLFTTSSVSPLFFTLDNRLLPVAAGAYPWPPMWLSDASGILAQNSLNNYLAYFYQQSASWSHVITSAFPGFYDIYKEAGVNPGFGFLDRLNGITFSSTLHLALSHHPDVIQIVTWNDYGEGTIIEPTTQFGYQYLDSVQSIKVALDTTFPFKMEDLQLPLRIYNSRMQFVGNSQVNSLLNRVFDLIIAGQRNSAISLMDSLPTHVPLTNMEAPGEFSLNQNYPNPFNPSTVISYQLTKSCMVSLKVFDLLGREVVTLVNEVKSAGSYNAIFNAPYLSSGVYFYRLQAGLFTDTKKLVLLR